MPRWLFALVVLGVALGILRNDLWWLAVGAVIIGLLADQVTGDSPSR